LNDAPQPPPRRVATPWATISIVAASIVATAWPAASEALLFDHARIVSGQVWRLWTGHLAHFGWSHLGWNVLVFAVSGGWAERIAPRRTRLFSAIGAPVIGLALFAFDSALQRYGGLSGLAAGTVALLAMVQLSRHNDGDRWFWRVILGLLIAKIVIELASRQPMFTDFAGADIHTVPIAHVAGMLIAISIHLRSERHRRSGARH
jgi:rhomboid family GlyGly-CTERM serine protease